MIPNFSKPFSAFTDGDRNLASCVIGQHYEAIDRAIDHLIKLYDQRIDIGDEDIFNAVMARYGLFGDGFESEKEYIIKRVSEILRARLV